MWDKSTGKSLEELLVYNEERSIVGYLFPDKVRGLFHKIKFNPLEPLSTLKVLSHQIRLAWKCDGWVSLVEYKDREWVANF